MAAIKKTIVEIIDDYLLKNVEFGFNMSEGEFSNFIDRNTKITVDDDNRKIRIEMTIPTIDVFSRGNSVGDK